MSVSLLKVLPVSLLKEHGWCTCCPTPRPIHRTESGEEWAHLGSETFADTFHVHRSYSSSDCDGTYYDENVLRITSVTDPHNPNDHDRYTLWNEAVRQAVWGHAAKMTIEIDTGSPYGPRDYDQHRASFSEVHDEGYRNTELRGCTDTMCDIGYREHRDFRAESMGY